MRFSIDSIFPGGLKLSCLLIYMYEQLSFFGTGRTLFPRSMLDWRPGQLSLCGSVVTDIAAGQNKVKRMALPCFEHITIGQYCCSLAIDKEKAVPRDEGLYHKDRISSLSISLADEREEQREFNYK